MSTELATQRTVLDIVAEYDEKAAAADDTVRAYEAACTAVEMAGTVMGTYAEPVLRQRSYLRSDDIRRNLLKSGWKAIYNRLQIDRIASANDKRLFERTIADPPPLTFDNAKATFGPYLENPRLHILRGLAETFSSLDPAYRSHSKVKVGVKGLPKRVILSGFGSYGSYGRDKLRDIVNALAAYRGQPLMEHVEFNEIDALHRQGKDAALDGHPITFGKDEPHTPPNRGLVVRKFANGNAHVIFDADALLDINRGLAEFYGDVLPDVEPEDVKRATGGTNVSKDLQFYWTPGQVAWAALEFASVHNLGNWGHNPPAPIRVLEPSCGDGRLLDQIKAYGHAALGIEYHPGRAAEAKAKGHNVLCANFLECPAKPEFDRVVMNPPFYGRHYVKHVRHALRFLKPGGVLVSILPASAHYDHQELQGEWRDLPVASFSEAGTNVPTGMLKMRAAA